MEWRQIVPLLLLCAESHSHASTINETIEEMELNDDRPTMLVETIRRQLMNDNYDYMPLESDETFPIKHAVDSEHTTQHTSADDYFQNDKVNELDLNINDHFIPRANDLKADDFEDNNSHAIAKGDLLYYIDDDRLTKKASENDTLHTNGVVETTSPKVKYKVLKVKQPHPNRRSHSFRRFIQEEGGDGVALINMDPEPFPEFRLPRTRRQYMMDHHDLDSEEDATRSDVKEVLGA